MEAWRITQVTYLGGEVHDCIHFLGRQDKAEKVHGLDVTLDKLQKAGGSCVEISTIPMWPCRSDWGMGPSSYLEIWARLDRAQVFHG